MKRLLAIMRAPIWWGSKVIPAVSSALFVLALTGPSVRDSAELATSMAVYLIALTALAVFGHLANDFSDRELDARSGKVKPSQSLPSWLFVVMLILLPTLSLILVFALERDLSLTAWWAGAFGVAAAYSLEPLRLKSRGTLGWWASALPQRAFPVALAVMSLDEWTVSGAFLAIYSLLVGLRFIMIHQLDDFETDHEAGVKTGVVKLGRTKTVFLVTRVVWPLEVLALVGLVFSAGRDNLVLGVLVVLSLSLAVFDSLSYGYFSARHRPLGVKNDVLASFAGVYLPVVVSFYSLTTNKDTWFIAVFILVFTVPLAFRRMRFVVNKLGAG